MLWYCHKRGREVRLEKERLLTEQEVAQLEAEYESSMGLEGLTTTAPEGAAIDAVQAGVREVQQARENQWKGKRETEGNGVSCVPSPYPTPSLIPSEKRNTAKSSIEEKNDKNKKIEAYPGT